MKITAKTDYDNVVYDKDNTIHMMASIQAPPLPEDQKRNPLNIVAVLDRSGSMSGHIGTTGLSKMDYLRQSMYKMIENLTENDNLAIVFFDSLVTVVPWHKMTSAGKESLKKEVAKTHPRNSTDIGSALREAIDLFANFESSGNAVERILLLTDGETNLGMISPEQFVPMIEARRHGVGISCFGYGDSYNEELLEAVSKQGKGSNYYIETVDSVAKAFATELGGLLTCFAQDLVVNIKPHKGCEVVDVLNDFNVKTEQDTDGDLVTKIEIDDIYFGEKRDIVVAFKCDKRQKPLPRAVTFADIEFKMRRLSDNSVQSESHKVRVSFVKTQDEATKDPDKEVAEQVALLKAAHIQIQAKKLADIGNFEGARHMFASASSTLRGVGTEATLAYAADMDAIGSDISLSGYSTNVSKSIHTMSSSRTRRSSYAVGTSSLKYCSEVPASNTFISSMVDNFAQQSSSEVPASNTFISPMVDNFAQQSSGPKIEEIEEDDTEDKKIGSGFTKTRIS